MAQFYFPHHNDDGSPKWDRGLHRCDDCGATIWYWYEDRHKTNLDGQVHRCPAYDIEVMPPTGQEPSAQSPSPAASPRPPEKSEMPVF